MRLRALPGTGVVSQAIAEGRSLLPVGEHREADRERVRGRIEFVASRRRVVAEHRGDQRIGHDKLRLRDGMETRQPAAGSQPDRSVGFGKISVGITVVPNEAVRRVVADPMAPAENGGATIGGYPVTAARVEELRVHDIAGKAVLGRVVIQPDMGALEFDPRDPGRREVVDPDRPVRT